MKRILFLSAIVVGSLLADDHRDHDDRGWRDKRHKDYHQWNDHEDRAYHMYWEQRHRPYRSWESVNERDRQAYWNWRHNHSDALLKIDIH